MVQGLCQFGSGGLLRDCFHTCRTSTGSVTSSSLFIYRVNLGNFELESNVPEVALCLDGTLDEQFVQ